MGHINIVNTKTGARTNIGDGYAVKRKSNQPDEVWVEDGMEDKIPQGKNLSEMEYNGVDYIGEHDEQKGSNL